MVLQTILHIKYIIVTSLWEMRWDLLLYNYLPFQFSQISHLRQHRGVLAYLLNNNFHN
jgi:hypothetical protein